MDQLLRDPIWQFVGVAISLVALVVAVIAIRAQQQRRSLGYYFASDRPILYVFDDKLKDRLTLSLDGQPVRGLSTYEVAVFNDGNVPILPADYVEPLRIQFGTGFKVLAVAVSDSSPPDLGVAVEAEGGAYRASPALLNPGDHYVIQFLVDQSSRDHYASPTVRGRIAGVKELKSRSSRPAAAFRLGFYRFVLARAAPAFILGVAASIGVSALTDFVLKLIRAAP